MAVVFAYVNQNQQAQQISDAQINDRGNWSASATYNFPDVVFYSDSYWLALALNQDTPPETQETTQTGNWSALTIVDGQYTPPPTDIQVQLAQEQRYRVVSDGTLGADIAAAGTLAQHALEDAHMALGYAELALFYTGTTSVGTLSQHIDLEQRYRAINDGTLTPLVEFWQEQHYRAINDGTLTPLVDFWQEQNYRAVADGTLAGGISSLTSALAQEQAYRVIADGTLNTNVAQAEVLAELALYYIGTNTAADLNLEPYYRAANDGTLTPLVSFWQEQAYRAANDGTLNTNVADLTSDLALEQTYRVVAEGTLNTNVADTVSDLALEQTYRAINDGTLTVNLAEEQSHRVINDGTLNVNLAEEQYHRVLSDGTINVRLDGIDGQILGIDGLLVDVFEQIGTLNADLSQEERYRVVNDGTLNASLAQEQRYRVVNDGTLNDNLAEEQYHRVLSDGTLNVNLAEEQYHRVINDGTLNDNVASVNSVANFAYYLAQVGTVIPALSELPDVSIPAPSAQQVLVYDGSKWIASATPATIGAGATTFYLDDTSSGTLDYKNLALTPSGAAEEIDTVSITGTGVPVPIHPYLSPELNRTVLDAGIWEFDTYASVSNGTRPAYLVVEVYTRDIAGAETFRFSGTSEAITETAPVLQALFVYRPSIPVVATDRLVAKYYAFRTDSPPEVDFSLYHSGTAHVSRIHSPLAVQHNDLAGLQGGGEGAFYHLTSAEHSALEGSSGSVSAINRYVTEESLWFEQTTRVTAEGTINANITTLSQNLEQEQTYRAINDGTLNDNLSQEQAYRIASEGTLYQTVLSLTNDLYTDLWQEQTYRVVNDGTLNNNVAQAQTVANLALELTGTAVTRSGDSMTGHLTVPSLTVSGSIAALDSMTMRGTLTADSIILRANAGVQAGQPGQMTWNQTDQTVDIAMGNPGVTLQVGQETYVYAYNDSGVDISDGEVVYISGSVGQRTAVKRASAANRIAARSLHAVATEYVPAGRMGYFTIRGLIHGLDTSAYVEGGPLYLWTTDGSLSPTPPAKPNSIAFVAVCIKNNASDGHIWVSPVGQPFLSELSDINVAGRKNYDQFYWDGDRGYWRAGAAPWTNINNLNVSGTTTLSGNVIIEDGLPVLAQEQAYRAANDGTLTPLVDFWQEQAYRLTADGTAAANLAEEQAYRVTNDGTLTANLALEQTYRVVADGTLNTNVITLTDALAQEQAYRAFNDGTLSVNLGQEQSYRVISDGTLNADMGGMAAYHTSQFGTLNTNVTTLTQDLALEQSYRVINDGTLNTNVTTLTSNLAQAQTYRAVNDGTLANDIAQAQRTVELAISWMGTSSVAAIPVNTVTSSLVLAGTHGVVFVDTSLGNINVILPSGTGLGGRQHSIKKIAAANTLNVIPNGLIDNMSLLEITASYVAITVISDGANWKII